MPDHQPMRHFRGKDFERNRDKGPIWSDSKQSRQIVLLRQGLRGLPRVCLKTNLIKGQCLLHEKRGIHVVCRTTSLLFYFLDLPWPFLLSTLFVCYALAFCRSGRITKTQFRCLYHSICTLSCLKNDLQEGGKQSTTDRTPNEQLRRP